MYGITVHLCQGVILSSENINIVEKCCSAKYNLIEATHTFYAKYINLRKITSLTY